MSYPTYIHTDELARYGFEVNPDNPREAVCTLYPTLSARYQCDKCGVRRSEDYAGCSASDASPAKPHTRSRDKRSNCICAAKTTIANFDGTYSVS